MRVSFVVDSDAYGGAEAYVRHHLRRAAAHGVRASLVVAEPVADRFADLTGPGGARADVVPLARAADAAPRTRAALVEQRPDVVLVNLVDPASNAAALRAAVAVAPTAATLHLGGDTAGRPGREALRRLYGRLAAVLTAADDVAHQLVADLAVPRSRIHVVPNGVDVPARASWPRGGDPPVVGALGRLTEQKGFDVLLAAVAVLQRAGVPLQLRIGGAGRDADRLAAAAAGLPVCFDGFVTDVPGWLAHLDVFCLPSRRETLPLALSEAMAAGLPCVATDVGGVRAGTAGAALVVPPEDPDALSAALRGLLLDADARVDLARRARSRAVAALDAGLMAQRTYALLRAVVRPAVVGPPGAVAAPHG